MRNQILFAFLALLSLQAQAQHKETIELLPGVTTQEALQGEIYLYPQFTEGIVAFKNGRNGKSKLNYCFLTNEMLFISPAKDTLALLNVDEIKMISIGSDTFYTNGNQVLKQSHNYGWIKTAHQKSIKEKGRKKVGSYGETVDGVAVSLTSMNVASRFVDLASSDKIILQKETRFYISNEANQFMPLNKNYLLKLIPKEKQQSAQNLLKDKNLDFNNIEQVHQFLLQLTMPHAIKIG